jgi:hypothetical protein
MMVTVPWNEKSYYLINMHHRYQSICYLHLQSRILSHIGIILHHKGLQKAEVRTDIESVGIATVEGTGTIVTEIALARIVRRIRLVTLQWFIGYRRQIEAKEVPCGLLFAFRRC